MSNKKSLHRVSHHNMYGVSCEVAGVNNADDFKIQCHREHKITVPQCDGCLFFGGDEMGNGVCCIWDETYEEVPGDDHIVQHDETYFEFQRVENPTLYAKMCKMTEDGEIDVCKVWQNLD